MTVKFDLTPGTAPEQVLATLRTYIADPDCWDLSDYVAAVELVDPKVEEL